MNRFDAQPGQESGLEPILCHGEPNMRKLLQSLYPSTLVPEPSFLPPSDNLADDSKRNIEQTGPRLDQAVTPAEPCHSGPRQQTALKRLRFGAVLCLLLTLTGCQAGVEEEAEHHRPEHKPHDFLAAIERLQQLETELANTPPPAAGQLDVWQETYDLVRWLPELGAESDLPEAAWNELDDAARQLEQDLVRLMKTDRPQRSAGFRERQKEIALQLQRLDQIKQQFNLLTVGAASSEAAPEPSPSQAPLRQPAPDTERE